MNCAIPPDMPILRTSALALVLAVPLAIVACAPAPSDSQDAAESEVRSGGLVRQDLPAGPFRDRAGEIAQEWLDGNIMTGDARIDAGRFKGTLSPEALTKFAETMVTDHLREMEEGTMTEVSTTTPPFTDALIKDAAKVVAVDGFVFDPSNPDNIKTVEGDIRTVTGFLGDPTKLDAVTLRARIKEADPDHDAVSLWIFVNRETKEFAAFYAREGTV